MMNYETKFHQPKMHKTHSNRPCGCWTGQNNTRVFVCALCSAAYLDDEVAMFPLWRCYDCGTRHFTNEYGAAIEAELRQVR